MLVGGATNGCGAGYVHTYTVYGAALLDHALTGAGFDEGALLGDTAGE